MALLGVLVGWLALAPSLARAQPEATRASTKQPAKTEAAGARPVDWQISERTRGTRGGELVVTQTSEPRTYLPLAAYDTASRAVVERMHAGLVRQDGESFEIQPALASSWTISADRTRILLRLRSGVRFSDGEPFDADDVLFSLRAVQDPAIGAAHFSSVVIDGEPVEVSRLGPLEVELRLPFSHPTPLQLITGIAMLPEHILGPRHAAGTLADAWSVGTEPAEIAGLGPFRLVEHRPGSHLTLERNPHYWRRDAPAPQGEVLPYLDRLRFEFVPDETAEVLRFRVGSSHLLERIPGDAFARLEALESKGASLQLRDLGAGLGTVFMIFNLNEVENPEVERRRRWFEQSALRRAVSLAVDRPAIAHLVYHGRATPVVSDISPTNREYYDQSLDAQRLGLGGPEPDLARRELRSAGFTLGDDGAWRDPAGNEVTFTLATNTSNSKRSAIATLVVEDLQRIGLDVSFVGLEFGDLVNRLTGTFDYDLILLEFSAGTLDPSSALNVWRIDGDSHYFRLGADAAGFPWEAKIDRLMRDQARTIDVAERKRMVFEMQQVVAREVPFVYLVAPNVLVGAAEGLGNFAPSVLEHPTLWNADELFWRTPARNESGGDT